MVEMKMNYKQPMHDMVAIMLQIQQQQLPTFLQPCFFLKKKKEKEKKLK